MINSRKYRPHTGNRIPVWELPGEFCINVREPWKYGDPGTPETFSCGLRKENYDKVHAIIKEIVVRHGGKIADTINVYGGVYVENMTDTAMEEICTLDYVHSVGPNVSILPPASERFYNRKTTEKPDSYESDVIDAAIQLAKHGVL